MALEAGAAARPTMAACRVPRRQDEALAGAPARPARSSGPDQEGDRALRADEQLRGRVLVDRVPVARTVAPGGCGSTPAARSALARHGDARLPGAVVGERLERPTGSLDQERGPLDQHVALEAA